MATCPTCRVSYGAGETRCPADGAGLLPDEAFSATDPDLHEGDLVGEYRVVGKLGEGGFGAVFSAVHPLIGKEAAIKVLHRQFSSNPQIVSRFIAEARAVNQIRHRNIIDIFAFGQLPDGRQYYVMELLAGATLDRWLAGRSPLPLAQALPLLRSLARALDAAHAKGIAHRDLKPENVFVSVDEEGAPFPKLLDFGIAKLLGNEAPMGHKTRTGAPIGTPYYMSPEQCRGREVDHRTDVYSFGVMTYQMLAGRLPFTGQDVMDVLMKQITETAAAPSTLNPALPRTVDAKILWFLEKEPDRRPGSVIEGVRAIEEAAVAAGLVAPSPSALFPVTASGGARPGGVTPASGPGLDGTLPADVGHAATLAGATPPLATPSAALAPAPAAATPAAMGTPLRGLDPPVVPPRRSRATWLIAGIAAVAGVGAAVYVLGPGEPRPAATTQAALGVTPGEPTPEVPEPTPAVTPAPPDAAPAPVEPALPATVSVDVQGVPSGTRVRTADGALLGTAPGRIELARGQKAIELRFEADGFKPATRRITPSADVIMSLELKPKKKRSRRPDKESVDEDPFGDGSG